MRKSFFHDVSLKHIKAYFYTTGNELRNLLAQEVVSAGSTSKHKRRLGKLKESIPVDTRGAGRDVPTDLPRQQLWSQGRRGQRDWGKQLFLSSILGCHLGTARSISPGKTFLTLF